MKCPSKGDVFHQDEPLEICVWEDTNVAVKLEYFPLFYFVCSPSKRGWVYTGERLKEEEVYARCTDWN